MKAGVLSNGRQPLPENAELRRFIITATLRREFPYLTQTDFMQLSPREVRFHLAYLQGVAEGNEEIQKRAKSG